MICFFTPPDSRSSAHLHFTNGLVSPLVFPAGSDWTCPEMGTFSRSQGAWKRRRSRSPHSPHSLPSACCAPCWPAEQISLPMLAALGSCSDVNCSGNRNPGGGSAGKARRCPPVQAAQQTPPIPLALLQTPFVEPQLISPS